MSTDPQKDCVVSASKASILFYGSSTFRLWKSCTVHSVVHVLHVCLDLWCVSVQAHNMGLTTENHLWMFPAWYNAGWWNTSVDGTTSEKNCTREEVRDKVVLFSLSSSHTSIHMCDLFVQHSRRCKKQSHSPYFWTLTTMALTPMQPLTHSA